VLLYCHFVPGGKSSPSPEDRFRRRGPLHVGEDVVLRPVVLISRCHREQLPDADVIRPGQPRMPLRDLVVERELAVLREQHDGGSGELLADGTDRVAHRGGGGCSRRDARVAICLRVDDLAAANDRDAGARRSRRPKHGDRGAVDLGALGWRDLLRYDGGSGNRQHHYLPPDEHSFHCAGPRRKSTIFS
jgi:hypothetical protein